MSLPSPGFLVYRDNVLNEPFDPCAPPQFYPPKDSDELFFALKAHYPLVKTHSERMRNAVIEFLMRERDEEQLKNQAALAPSEPTMPAESTASFESSAASPWSSYPSASSSSAFSSPDLLGWATPASLASPAAQPATLSRQPTRRSVLLSFL